MVVGVKETEADAASSTQPMQAEAAEEGVDQMMVQEAKVKAIALAYNAPLKVRWAGGLRGCVQ